jgi:putative transposase
MKKARYTEKQIAFALRQAETETAVAEVCRKLVVSEQTSFYRLKKQYVGPGVGDIRRLKQLASSSGSWPRAGLAATPPGRQIVLPESARHWVKDQLGTPALKRQREPVGTSNANDTSGGVNLDSVFGAVHARPPASTLSDAGGASERQLRDLSREIFMVEGKGFEPSTSALRTPRSPN